MRIPLATVNRSIPKSELARNLEVDSPNVNLILKLTAQAPDMVEAIINGEEPDGLSLVRLIHSFPEELSEQRTLLGFENIDLFLSIATDIIFG
jgi:hypothetical protein